MPASSARLGAARLKAGAGRVCVLLTPPLPYSEAAARCREGRGRAEIWGGDGDNNVTLTEIAESLGTTTGAFWMLNTGSSFSPKPSLRQRVIFLNLRRHGVGKHLFFSVIEVFVCQCVRSKAW